MGIGEVIVKRAVFLDRDGVINRNVLNPATGEYEAPRRAGDFALLPGAIAAMKRLQRAGFKLILVSNQPDYAKGKASLEDLAAVHERFVLELARADISFLAFYYCHHHPQGITPGYSGPCDCRKPSPYFLTHAAETFSIALAPSWMVGDRATDIACGIAAGVHTIRVAGDPPLRKRNSEKRNSEEPAAEYEAADLPSAVDIILKAQSS